MIIFLNEFLKILDLDIRIWYFHWCD